MMLFNYWKKSNYIDIAMSCNYTFISMKKYVSVIIPACNEEQNIPLLIEEFKKHIPKWKFKCEVIIVDDGSTDKTYTVAKDYTKKCKFLKVLKHRKNFGITQALLTGFEIAKGDIYVFFPADLQYEVKEIEKLVDPIIEDKADIVTGWKQGKYEKKFVSSVYNYLSRKIFKVPVHDLNTIKAFKKEVVDDVIWRKDWHRYMVVIAYYKGYRVKEVKVKLFPRRYGKSKFGFWRIPIGVLDLISVKLLLSFAKKPMLLFGSIGGTFILLGFLIGLTAVILRVFFQIGFRPLLYLVILLIVSGLILFVIGFLGEQILLIKDELENLKRKKCI